MFTERSIDMARRKSTFWTSRNTAIASIILAIPFIVITLMIIFNKEMLNQIDFNLGSQFHNLRTDHRSEIAIGITTIGDIWSQTAIAVMVTTLLFTLREFKAGLWYGFTVLIGALFINGYVKVLFGRVRPDYVEHLVHESTFAFPSGHAMGTTILFGAIAFIVYRLFRNEPLFKWLVVIYCTATAVIIGLSRVYLGVHYPSDVLAGFSLGAAWLFLSISAVGLSATRR